MTADARRKPPRRYDGPIDVESAGQHKDGGYALAIDLGTGGPKVAIVSFEGQLIGSESASVSLILCEGGGVEQSPAEWWAAIQAATRRLLDRRLVPAAEVAAISCTAQWAGTVAVDDRGSPLMNALTWMDSRGGPHVRALVGGFPRVSGYQLRKLLRWIRRTGGAPGLSGKDPVGHILYIRMARPDVYAATHKFLEPKDYLNLLLTGRYAASTDSIALHWVTDNRDPNHIAYDAELLDVLGLDRSQLPDLYPATDVLGPLMPEPAAALGLPEGIPVVMGTPDLQSATLGSGAIADFEPHLYIGTSSWLSCHVPFKKTDPFRDIASLPAALPGRYVVADEQQTAGRALEYLRDNLLFPDDALAPPDAEKVPFEALDSLAAEIPSGSDGVIFTPWLNGERTPVDDDTLRASFFNQSLATRRGHLVRAVYEGVAFNTCWLLETVERFVGRRLDDINFIGGGARSDLWCQILANVLDRSIRQLEDPIEANVRGAAMLAGLALGRTTQAQLAGSTRIARTYTPDPASRAQLDQMYRAFRDLHKATRKIHRRLHQTTLLRQATRGKGTT